MCCARPDTLTHYSTKYRDKHRAQRRAKTAGSPTGPSAERIGIAVATRIRSAGALCRLANPLQPALDARHQPPFRCATSFSRSGMQEQAAAQHEVSEAISNSGCTCDGQGSVFVVRFVAPDDPLEEPDAEQGRPCLQHPPRIPVRAIRPASRCVRGIRSEARTEGKDRCAGAPVQSASRVA